MTGTVKDRNGIDGKTNTAAAYFEVDFNSFLTLERENFVIVLSSCFNLDEVMDFFMSDQFTRIEVKFLYKS